MRIAVLHPGEMGVSVAQALQDAGHEVGWVNADRSAATVARAAPFHPLASLIQLSQWAAGVVSVCPPAHALQVACAVQDAGFTGIYVDANAVAPETARQISALYADHYVDGGIIGPPAIQPDTTRLYLSGAQAKSVQGWFAGSNLVAKNIGENVVQASALKMAYAAYTKGNSALLLAVSALAEAAGVRDELESEWELSQPQLLKSSRRAARGTSRKAWRFVGEMEQIAATFVGYGLPDDFHKGAADLYQRMAVLQDQPPAEIDVVIAQILGDYDESKSA